MIRFFGQRLLVMLVRWIIVFFLLLLVIELSYGVLGGSDEHVWEIDFSRPLQIPGDHSGAEGWTALFPRLSNSMTVVGLAWGVTLVVGYSWGILAARLRKLKGHFILPLPWLVLASIPGFWWVIQVAIYSYFAWERPGFANEIVVESGPDLMGWWNLAVVSIPLAALGVSVQLRSVCERIREEAALPFVPGLYRAGYPDSEIFYQNILRRVRGDLVGLADETLPILLGGLIVVEVAFRFEGMGGFLVQSLRESYFPGILFVGSWMAGIIGLAALVREVLVHALGED